MSRIRRSPDALQNLSEHLFYEFWMFNSLAQTMSLGIFGHSVLNNAVLESFTLHARALLDFLYAERPRADDVIAEDYFDNPVDWLTVRPNKTELLMVIHKRVGKEVAHLTYARLDVTAQEKRWHYAQIANDLKVVFDTFLANVNKAKLGASWENNSTFSSR